MKIFPWCNGFGDRKAQRASTSSFLVAIDTWQKGKKKEEGKEKKVNKKSKKITTSVLKEEKKKKKKTDKKETKERKVDCEKEK